MKGKTKIISLNDVGDLTYPYQSLNGSSEIIKDIVENNHKISNLIKDHKISSNNNWKVIVKSKVNKYIYESMKNFLIENNKISNEWNSFNILSQDASSIGNL